MASRSGGRAAEAAVAAEVAALGVPRLLELERQIYQESIDRVAEQRAQLRAGALEAFVLRCLPFETERERAREAAMAQLQLNKRNGLDLLEFELQAAEDIFRDERRRLRQRLLDAATRRLRTLERRRRALDAGNAQRNGDDLLAYRPELVERVKRERVRRERRRARERALPGRVDAETLEKELEHTQRDAQRAFNFRHMKFAVPPPARIVRDVSEALGAIDTRSNPGNERKVVQADEEQLVCSCVDWRTHKTESTTFRVDDAVVLVSRLSEEEFHGQIVALSRQQVRLELVCGSCVAVDFDRLRDGRCWLRHLSASSPRSSTESAATEDVRASPSVRRRAAMEMSRRRRKTTVDIRQGF